MDDLMEVDLLGENASELINRLSRQLEHSRDLNDLFTTFVDIDKLDIPEEVKNKIHDKRRGWVNDSAPAQKSRR